MPLPRLKFVLTTAIALTVLAGCATGTGTSPEDAEGPPESRDALRTAPVEPFPRISMSLEEATLGQAVRGMAERHGGSLVLMNGIEGRELGRVSLNQAPFDRTAEGWAKDVECALQKTPSYYFVYPPGYEALTRLSLVGALHPRYDDIKEPITFGAGMSLYALSKWMGEALELTIVMDNIVGEAACGEITLGSVPLTASIEALLKSARIAECKVDSTEEYIFIGQPRAWLRRPTLMQENELTARQRAYLDERVTVRLPNPQRSGAFLELTYGAQSLEDALPLLSAQLGITVVAEPELADLPVNPVLLHDVPVKTAMDLLIWQWPVPEFGYQFASDRLVIRRLTADELAAQREAYLAAP